MQTKSLNITSDNVLSGGIYSLKEAAFFSRLSTKTLKRWYLGDSSTNQVFQQKELIEDGDFINFLDFIQALAVRELRVHHNVPLPKIREAVSLLQNEYNITYPFARHHRTYSDGNKILIQIENNLIQLNRPHANQLTMKPIVELYLRELKFNAAGLAHQYRPAEGIVLDPSLRFGEPLLEKSGYTALSIYDSVISEGDFDIVSALYDIELDQVKYAYKYIDSLKNAA